MGLAASQARFLTLTARKSNIEFQGQQINQQRTVLANKSADVVNKMLSLKPPVPPTSTSHDYYKVAQNFANKGDGTVLGQSVTGQSEKIKGWKLVDASAAPNYTDPTNATTVYSYQITYSFMYQGQEMEKQMYTPSTTVAIPGNTSLAQQALLSVFRVDDATGDIVQKMVIDNHESFGGAVGSTSSYDTSDLIYGTSFDDVAYDESMNSYDFDKYSYDKAIADINAETSGIQSKDKSLELKLKQLDSEHNAIQTELEAVKKVIDKNIESTFKTFA